MPLIVAVGVLAAALCTTALATAAGSRAGRRNVSAIRWGPCSDPNLKSLHAQCGFLSVPLNYSKPHGRKIQLAVSRIRHTSKHYQGIILTNPGGPGGSGLNLNAFLIPVLKHEGFTKAAAGYDWIGFDPRGVGSSKPAISCKPNYFHPDRPYYVPQTKRLLHYWLASSKSYAKACASRSSLQTALLHHMTTRDVAKDLDSIRKALGQSKLTYYGFSYGTYLGQVYSTMFPSHVRRIIMDSNVDPRHVWYKANLEQDLAFNRNENIWFGWLAKYHKVYHLGSTEKAVQKLFYATEQRLRKHPAAGKVGPDEWVDAFLLAGYYEQTWLQLGHVFSAWINHHNAKPLIAAYKSSDTPGNDNSYAVYDAVQCTDVQWPTAWSKWSKDNSRIYRKAPLETWGNAWFNAPCIYWPAPASHPTKVNGRGIKSALLIDETLDAATPFDGSLYVRKLFPHSVLLAEPGGTTHADSLSGNLCVDGTIARYLTSGKLPPRKPNAKWDKTCKPLPRPVPGAAAQLRAPSRVRPLPATRLGLPAVEVR
ncbi:MAG: alpha/beta fold hydrolase [Solirubrobacterales bacterium]|nr:alpha/beta fold hydrolase [Solirubrobacterales bacterium]